jgi:hypothetical protein
VSVNAVLLRRCGNLGVLLRGGYHVLQHPSGQTGTTRESFLVMPDGVSDALVASVRERGVTPVRVDVSTRGKRGRK